jgi:hypothetical protein
MEKAWGFLKEKKRDQQNISKTAVRIVAISQRRYQKQ